MPLQSTDLTLVSRGGANANASMTQVKDFVLGGLNTNEALTWSNYPVSGNNDVSSPQNTGGKFDYQIITSIQFKNKDLTAYKDDDVIVLNNLGRGSAGTYRVTGRNTSTGSISVTFIASSADTKIEAGDRMMVSNLGPDVDTDQGNVVIINDTQPSGSDGDLWFQPTTSNFYIYDGGWVLLNAKYQYGVYYKNAVHDWEMDNTGATDVSGKVLSALEHMFSQIPKDGNGNDVPGAVGTLYFPAGIYKLSARVPCYGVGSSKRAGWVIKGDGMATKFYVDNDFGGIEIKFDGKDNYLTVQDLAIHPKRAINGNGLYLQNGDDTEAENPTDIDTDDDDLGIPSGGSNQQYGCQLINVNILADENKPNDEQKKKDANFFNYPLSVINFGRPRIERCIVWNHAERSNYSFANPTGIDYSASYGFKPEDTGITLNLSNCYSPWVDNCYFNGTARYGIFWNSSRKNTEGGTFTKLVINGADIGFWIAQARTEEGEEVQGRHPHLTFIDSHVNAARFGLHMNNVKYFHVADVLYYARNDKDRSVTLIDNQLINCHSGVLSNGYSGGALGNTQKKAIPDNVDYDFSGMTSDEKKDAEKDSLAKSPSRIHVKLIGTDDIDRPAGIQKNRGIVVRDNQLNAYMTRVDSQNRTAGQVRNNGQPVDWDDVDWQAPYQVEGPCEDIEIILPASSYYDGPNGSYDNSQYPPDYRMITSLEGPVKFLIAGYKDGFIADGTDADRSARFRLELKNKNPKPGEAITADTYKANVGNGSDKRDCYFRQYSYWCS